MVGINGSPVPNSPPFALTPPPSRPRLALPLPLPLPLPPLLLLLFARRLPLLGLVLILVPVSDCRSEVLPTPVLPSRWTLTALTGTTVASRPSMCWVCCSTNERIRPLSFSLPAVHEICRPGFACMVFKMSCAVLFDRPVRFRFRFVNDPLALLSEATMSARGGRGRG